MPKSRRGFTLVEMLVVVFIIGLLLALILPAVQRARVRARQVECLARMRELGTAVTQFADAQGQYPAAGYWDGATGSKSMRSWVVDVLPYAGQQNIYDKWNKDEPFDDDVNSNNLALSQTPLEFLKCPSDRQGNLSYVPNGGFAFSSGQDCPTGYEQGGWVTMDLGVDGNACTMRDRSAMKQMGVFFLQSWPIGSGTVRFNTPASIRDGASTTIMLSENVSAGRNGQSTSWADAWVANCMFFGSASICPGGDCAQLKYKNANNRSDPAAAQEAINASRKLPEGSPWLSSYHGKGVNIFLCDGSSRFLSEDVEGEVFAKLLTPAGSWLAGRLRQTPIDESNF